MLGLLKWIAGEKLANEILGDLLEQRLRRKAASPLGAAVMFWRAFAGVVVAIAFRRGLDAMRIWARSGFGLSGSASDVRQAGRSLLRTPWYSVTGVGVIALGMSLATTAFAVVDGVLFKPLPYRAPDELYVIAGAFSKLPSSPGGASRVISSASLPDLEAWSAVSAPATLAAFDTSSASIALTNDVRPRVARVDAAVLDVLGVRPLLGGFRPEHYQAPSAVRPILISYSLWQGHFGGSTSIVGQVAGLPETRVEIVGVLPRGFVFPSTDRRLAAEIVTPLFVEASSRNDVRSRWLTVIGRVPAATPLAEIEARLAGAMQKVATTWPPVVLPPTANETMRITRGPADVASIRPLDDVLTSADASVSRIVFFAASFLVLLSALTVAGLAASRLEDRRVELTLRRALGGSYGRILRLLAAESAVIVVAGATIAWLAVSPLLGITLRLMPPGLMHLKPPVLDSRVLMFGALASAITVAIVTIWAARSATSRRFGADGSTGRSTPGLAAARARSLLIAAQVAVAVVMAVAGALLAASLARVWSEDPGFNPDRAATIRINQVPGTAAANIGPLVTTVRGLAGVTAAAGLGEPFLEAMFNGNGFERPDSARGEIEAEGISVTGGFFAAAGLQAVQGRLPTDAEFDRGDPVLAVSELVARVYWPGTSAIGKRLKQDRNGREFEVVGVVADARFLTLDRDPAGAIYSSLAVEEQPTLMNVIARFDNDAASSMTAVAMEVGARFPMYRVRSVRTITTSLGESIRTRRFQTWLFSAFGLAAIVLTGAGILGVMAMTTARRTREVGIRMAIGATRTGVISQLLREQMLTVSIGLITGAGLAAWSAQFIRAFVYKLDVYDARVWAMAILTVVATATIGTLIPASRASRVDPAKALRAD